MVLKVAYRAGVPTGEFWDQTPFETRLCVEAFNENRLDEDERSMHTAWHTAYFHRIKDMPRLSEMLAPYRKHKAAAAKTTAAVAPAASASPSGVDPNMSRDLMNALLQFPAGTVPGERLGNKSNSPEAPST